jgi:tRNA (guanine26-N2/guanine27-N2)-dimethyltransferase
MQPAGPVWLGSVQEPEVINAMRTLLPSLSLHTSRQLDNLLDLLETELPTSSHYDYHTLAKQAKVSPRPIEEVISHLRDNGFRASRAHYSGTALKTDAPAGTIILALTEKTG